MYVAIPYIHSIIAFKGTDYIMYVVTQTSPEIAIKFNFRMTPVVKSSPLAHFSDCKQS